MCIPFTTPLDPPHLRTLSSNAAPSLAFQRRTYGFILAANGAQSIYQPQLPTVHKSKPQIALAQRNNECKYVGHIVGALADAHLGRWRRPYEAEPEYREVRRLSVHRRCRLRYTDEHFYHPEWQLEAHTFGKEYGRAEDTAADPIPEDLVRTKVPQK